MNVKNIKHKGTKELLKLIKLKKIIFPIIYLFDKLRIFWLISPILKISTKIFNIDKEFNYEFPYRKFSKIFKNAFVKNKTSKKILFVYTKGANESQMFTQLLLAKGINYSDYNVTFLICDGFLKICDRERYLKDRNTSPFFCKECYKGYEFISKETELNVEYFSSYFNQEEDKLLNGFNLLVQKLNTVEECINFEYDQIDFGKLTLNSIYRHFNIGSLEDNEFVIDIYKKRITETYRQYLMFSNYLKINKNIKNVIFWNGVLSTDAIMRYVCERNRIDYFTQENHAHTENSWIYKKNGIAVYLQWKDEWEKYKDNEVTEEEFIFAENFIKEIKSGQRFGKAFNDGNEFSLDNSKRYVGLFTNLIFDTYVIGRNPLFKSMNDWLIKVIDYWNSNVEDKVLIIRSHPAEEKILMPVFEFVRDIVKNKLTKKILFIDSSEKVSSYYILENIDYGLIYGSSIGFEMIINNLPCLSAGATYYDEFLLKAKNQNEYFNLIEKLNKNKIQFSISQNELYKFINFQFKIKMKKWEGIDINKKNGNISFKIQNLDLLLNKNNDILSEFIRELN